MNQLLMFVHFLGLMLGAAGGFASGIVMRRAQAVDAAAAATLRALGPILARVSLTGLVLMWASGLVMVWSRWGGPDALPRLFWLKFVFVLSLTAATVAIHLTYAAIRQGNTAAAARLPRLGPAAGVSALLAVLAAVYAFPG
jgi:hypothetical protein